jgi:acetyl esterase/lipase
MRFGRGVVRAGLRGCRPLFASRRISIGGKRRLYEVFTGVARAPKGTSFERDTVGGVPVLRVRPPGVGSGATLIYLHGGAYALGSAAGYRGLAARLASAAGMTAVVPDYSLSPEARYPVALEEMVAVYSRLLDEGLDPKRAVVVGDSAGGGLAVALAMALRDRGIEGPAAIGLICPWADLAIDVDGTRPVARDPLILPSMCAEWAPRYAGGQDPRLPGIPPVYGDMAGLPPIVMHSAGDDPLWIDAAKIESACAGTGIVEHRRFDGLWHVFHLQAGVLAEAGEAISDLGARLRAHAITEKVERK